MSNTKQLLVAALAANTALLTALAGEMGAEGGASGASGASGADAGASGAAAGGTKPRATRGAAANAAASTSEPKLTNDEVAAIVTKVKDHPNGGLPMAKALIAGVGVKKIAEIKDQATLLKLKTAAEEKLAELEDDGGEEEL